MYLTYEVGYSTSAVEVTPPSLLSMLPPRPLYSKLITYCKFPIALPPPSQKSEQVLSTTELLYHFTREYTYVTGRRFSTCERPPTCAPPPILAIAIVIASK